MTHHKAPRKTVRKGPRIQPPETLYCADALLTSDTLQALDGDSNSTRDRKVAAGIHPPPVTFGARGKRWRAGEMLAHYRMIGAHAIQKS
ncbi:transcriptional regulator [Variovorax sp. OV329]|uniref:transcriptional regulator n=1 Tax=Variovorax sp. OV329 TaxID=1882825 RepID=UPI001113C0D5|nr:transcriptional regulator [Variovorax sp. OV329]